MIAIGKIVYNYGKPLYPSKEGYMTIVVMMKSHSKWWPLSPYYLTTEEGFIIENVWQFSKVYRKVPASTQTYSRYDPTVIWEWPAQVHVDDEENLTDEYYNWREAGMKNKYAVRYPVGYHHKGECICSVDQEGNVLNYVEARRKIYIKEYIETVMRVPQYYLLLDMLRTGTNLLIVEVDGPHEESMPHYKKKYNVSDDWIKDNCMDATKENIEIMLKDTKHSFGHGYALSLALLDNI